MNKALMKWQSECKRYTVLLSNSCFAKMLDISRGNYPKEVGTSLFGCYSSCGFEASVLGVAPVTPDSKSTTNSFYRGVAGLREFYSHLWRVYRGSRHYVGEWHSHPDAAPFPSRTDDRNQFAIATDVHTNCPECILIIVGHSLSDSDEIGVYVYSRESGRIVLRYVPV